MINTDKPLRFSERFTITMPGHVRMAISRASVRRCQVDTEYARQAIIDRLKSDGFDVNGSPTEWAKVQGGEVVFTFAEGSNLANLEDRSGLLPVENVDSEPFDPALHYRHGSHFEVEPTRVLRVYHIVPKPGAN